MHKKDSTRKSGPEAPLPPPPPPEDSVIVPPMVKGGVTTPPLVGDGVPALYADDSEVRPKGGRINNSNRQIKLRTVPGKKIKRIADGT